VHRNQAGRSWITKAVVYSLSSALAGVAAGAVLGAVGRAGFGGLALSAMLGETASGAVLGAVGSLLPLDFRLAAGSLLAVVAIALGGLEFFGRRIQPLQFDCETPQRWVHRGAITWAIQNGLALGFGATSRIGFWLWYAIPLGAFLVGDPLFGAVTYGIYGLLRALGAVVILLVIMSTKVDISDWLIERHGTAKILATGQLTLLGVATAIVVGL
jgi:hypothetical protein